MSRAFIARQRKPNTGATLHAISGSWTPNCPERLCYGKPLCREAPAVVPTVPKIQSVCQRRILATQTPLIDQVEKLLGSAHLVGTILKIKQHVLIAKFDESVDAVAKSPAVDTLIIVGEGSLTDPAKTMAYRMYRKIRAFSTPVPDT